MLWFWLLVIAGVFISVIYKIINEEDYTENVKVTYNARTINRGEQIQSTKQDVVTFEDMALYDAVTPGTEHDIGDLKL